MFLVSVTCSKVGLTCMNEWDWIVLWLIPCSRYSTSIKIVILLCFLLWSPTQFILRLTNKLHLLHFTEQVPFNCKKTSFLQLGYTPLNVQFNCIESDFVFVHAPVCVSLPLCCPNNIPSAIPVKLTSQSFQPTWIEAVEEEKGEAVFFKPSVCRWLQQPDMTL